MLFKNAQVATALVPHISKLCSIRVDTNISTVCMCSTLPTLVLNYFYWDGRLEVPGCWTVVMVDQ